MKSETKRTNNTVIRAELTHAEVKMLLADAVLRTEYHAVVGEALNADLIVAVEPDRPHTENRYTLTLTIDHSKEPQEAPRG